MLLNLIISLPFLLAGAGNADLTGAAVAAAPEQTIMLQDQSEGLIGQKFRDLSEPDAAGKMHRLSEYAGRGKWVLVDFWASWCGPCRAEMPYVTAAYEKYHKRGLEIVGLSFDVDADDWQEAIRTLDMPWIHLSDLKGWQSKAGEVYGIRGIPDNVLINPEGIIVARCLRGDDLEAYLEGIFGASAVETVPFNEEEVSQEWMGQ